MTTRIFFSLLATLALLLSAAASAAAATVTIVVVDPPGVGFNDPTPAAPVGGNPGTTVGEQRLVSFQFAADVWGTALDSAVEIRIQASFPALSCTATTATLGSAGSILVVLNFPGAEFTDTLYTTALANKLAGVDLITPDISTNSDDIRARFNRNLGSPGCLTGIGWYYGLDTNQGNQISLVTVLLHEFAHGLGFASFANPSTGQYLANFSDVFAKFFQDNTTGKTSDQMTMAERKASFINPRNVVWTGSHVTGNVPTVLAPGTPLLQINSPSPIADRYQVGAAVWSAADEPRHLRNHCRRARSGRRGRADHVRRVLAADERGRRRGPRRARRPWHVHVPGEGEERAERRSPRRARRRQRRGRSACRSRRQRSNDRDPVGTDYAVRRRADTGGAGLRSGARAARPRPEHSRGR
jgi:hypothetical protein